MQFKQLNEPLLNSWSLSTISLFRLIKLTVVLMLFTYVQVKANGLNTLPIEVQGKVSNKKGDPIQNATVLINGTNTRAATNSAGLF